MQTHTPYIIMIPATRTLLSSENDCTSAFKKKKKKKSYEDGRIDVNDDFEFQAAWREREVK